MNTAIIESVTERNDPQYGPEKVSKIILEPAGESRTAYTKPAARDVYDNLRAGVRVELKAKPGGKGYWINKIIGEATLPTPAQAPQPRNGQAPEGQAGTPTAQEIATYIENKAGQIAHAYQSLEQHFSAIGKTFTPEIFNACISTAIISTDRHFNHNAGAWEDNRPLLVAGSPEWDQTVSAIQKHGAGMVDKIIAKARVTPIDEEYLRQIEKQSTD